VVAVLTPAQRSAALEEAHARLVIEQAHTEAILEDVRRELWPKRKGRTPMKHLNDLRRRWT